MIGDQIKYEPGWVKNIPEYYDPPSKKKKRLLKDLNVNDNLKSVS